MKTLLYKILFLTLISLGGHFVSAQLKDANYIKLLGINYFDGDKTEANRLLVILEKKYPNNGYILVEKGAWQLFSEDVNGALSSLSSAIKLLPKNDKAYMLRGMAFRKKGLLEKAIEDIRIAIDIDPEPLDYYEKLGGYLFLDNRFDESLEIFLIGVEKYPADYNIYHQAFDAYALLNNPTAATKLFNEGLTIKGMDTFLLRCAYANFFMRISDFKEAARQYQILADESESKLSADDLNSAAVSNNKLENYEKALYFINKALEKEVLLDLLTNKADIAFRLKDYDLMISTATKALAMDPDSILANMYMAIAYKWGKNDLEKAAYYENKANQLQEASK